MWIFESDLEISKYEFNYYGSYMSNIIIAIGGRQMFLTRIFNIFVFNIRNEIKLQRGLCMGNVSQRDARSLMVLFT